MGGESRHETDLFSALDPSGKRKVIAARSAMTQEIGYTPCGWYLGAGPTGGHLFCILGPDHDGTHIKGSPVTARA